MTSRFFSDPRALRNAGLLATVAAVVLGVLVFSLQKTTFMQAYLYAFLFWASLPLGAMAFVMVDNLTAGRWGRVTLSVMEACTRTMPVLAILFLPVLVARSDLFPLLGARPVESPSEFQKAYFTDALFIGRAVLYWTVWIVWAYLSLGRHRRSLLVNGMGLVLYFVTVSLASVDWAMSLEPKWHSTIYGLLFVAHQGVLAMAGALTLSWLLATRLTRVREAPKQALLDAGNLLLASLVVWGYCAYAQFLIDWSGNLPEEISWYLNRAGPTWRSVGYALVVLNILAPVFTLFFKRIKRELSTLGPFAAFMVFVQLVAFLWLIVPSFKSVAAGTGWIFAVVPVFIGAVWLLGFSIGLDGGFVKPKAG